MSIRSWPRLLPAIAVVALFCLVATAPAPEMPAPNQPPPCTDYAQSATGASSALFSLGDGVAQPLSLGQSVVACSLHVAGTGWCYVTVAVREWDPLALTPDPSTIATRTAYLDPSRLNYYTSNSVPWVRFSPPIVTQSVAGVAEPPGTGLFMEVHSSTVGYNYPLAAYYDPEGDPALAEAQSLSGGGSHETFQGTHPVLGHAVCSGDAGVQDLRIVQSVRRTDTPLSAHPYELLQRFRVPEPVDLRWVELAVNSTTVAAPAIGEEMPLPASAMVAIIDATYFGDPPTNLPSSLSESLFEGPYMFSYYSWPAPRWGTNLTFDHLVTLNPGHDYWLYVRDATGYEFIARSLTGAEDGAFTAGVGAFHTRALGATEWSQASGQVLSFKLIGRPTAPVGVSPPRGSAPFRLSVSPNPARGPLRVEWSGAVGPVRLEVFDARGRRMGRGEGGAAGAWSWATTGRDGRPAPSGVYFVHARDSAGELSVERLVLVR